jgi:Ca2+-transporting ATPase
MAQSATLAPKTGVQSPHHLAPAVVADILTTDLDAGLTTQEATRRLSEHGPNELQERAGPTIWQLTIAQFNNFLVYLLLAAAGISLLLQEWIDAVAILAIVILNAILGVVQEHRAGKAMEALKRMASPTARVVRDGQIVDIPNREVVPGDVLLLEAGNYVPADVRLVEAANLRVEEAALTGESEAVEKDASLTLPEDASLGDRRNVAFMGTLVTYGRGRSIVTATGMRAEIGKIATMLQSVEEEQTPLQIRLEQLGKVLGTACVIIAGLVFALGMGRAFLGGEGSLGEHVGELLLTAISLAIAAVPEGLPAIVTVCLAIGMQRMARRNALIRRLPAVETLGSATFICSDKTGTLTQNKMVAVQVYANEHRYRVTGQGYEPTGEILPFDGADGNVQWADDDGLRELLRCAVLCNDAVLQPVTVDDGKSDFRVWGLVGDPTEGALVALAGKAGLSNPEQIATLPRIAEVPFDSARKWMVTVHRDATSAAPPIAYLKGAPDVVLDLCNSIRIGGEAQPLGEAERRDILERNDAMARDALRVLGFASREMVSVPDRIDPSAFEEGCTFLGLVGMIDAARPEAKEAVRLCRAAGIRPVMITGDFLTTAVAIAQDLELLRPEGRAITGADLDKLDEAEFLAQVEEIDVYARVSPEHKVRIVDALMQRDHIAAMTGDGVNDAPALKRANIGVAMGITGTDVTKETADMVLTDDNFASIVSAVEEGRVIYSNIRQFVYFLISANVGEVLIVFIAMLVGLPLPLRPIHLLTLNLLTDGAPALALGVEKGDPDIMRQPARPAKEELLTMEMRWLIAVQGMADAAATLTAFVIALQVHADDLRLAQTIAFATLVLAELWRAYSARSLRWSLWSIGVFSNRYMVLATFASLAILLLAVYVPLLQPIFDTKPLSLTDWTIILPLSLIPVIAAEMFKAVLRARSRMV